MMRILSPQGAIARKPVFRLTPPRIPEAALHTQIANALRLEIAPAGRISAEGVVWWSVDIANYGGKTPGLRTSRGVIAGVPDMIVVYEGRAHFIELKSEKGKLSDAQHTVSTSILLAGGRFGVARSLEGVIEWLDAWKIPRKRRLRVAG